MAIMLGICLRSIKSLALILTCLQIGIFAETNARSVESMEMLRHIADRGAVDQAHQTDRLHTLSEDTEEIGLRLSHRSTHSTLNGESNSQPGPPECSDCDEKLPPPVHTSSGGTLDFSPWSTAGGADCCRMTGDIANCTHCRLTDVPNNLSPNITRLLLGHNAITDKSLSPGIFKRYPRLTVLSLSTNNITSLEDDIFEGLPVLKCLCLQYNPIKMDESLNSTLAFQPLNGSLVYLRLNGFNKDTDSTDLIYPSHALSFLPKLKYLFIDGIPFKKFENPWQQLPKLTHLVMAGFRYGHCNLTSLQSKIFEFRTLTYLDISDCNIQGRYVNHSAFENLENLQYLTINNNFFLGIQTVGDLMYSFRNNKNLKNLTMQRINPRFSPCIVIYNHTLRYFPNTALENIDASDNEIAIIERGALKMLPKTLRVISLKGNKIIFGDYIQDLGALSGLKDLKLEGSEVPYHFPNEYPSGVLNNCMKEAALAGGSPNRVVEQSSQITSIPLPPNLSKIYMAGNGMSYTLNNITFSLRNNLVSADLRGNILPYLYGPIKGLHNLSTVNMDNCDIKYISSEFFNDFPNLTTLSLYQNQLGKCLSQDSEGLVFKNLKNLTLMNLSENNLYHLNKLTFKNMAKLQHLDLSKNRLGSVVFSIAHMKHLDSLNLERNQIRSLTPTTRAEIHAISEGRWGPKIELSYNPIGCDCSNLEFLEWLTDRVLVKHNFTQYPYFCNTVLQPRGYEEVIATLRRECIQKEKLFAVVLSATMVLLLAVVIALAYRFR